MLNALRQLLGMPTAADAVAHMLPISQPPAPSRSHRDRSELLVVGEYEADGSLTLAGLAYFSMKRQAFVDAKTLEPVAVSITHWMLARDQHVLSQPRILQS